MRGLAAAKLNAAHQEAIKRYERSRKKGRPKVPEPGDEVLYCCEADLRKEGKQAATRYFGPYSVVEILDEAHCSIRLEQFKNFRLCGGVADRPERQTTRR